MRESQLLGNLKPNLNISQLVLDSKENVVLVEKGSWYLLRGERSFRQSLIIRFVGGRIHRNSEGGELSIMKYVTTRIFQCITKSGDGGELPFQFRLINDD